MREVTTQSDDLGDIADRGPEILFPTAQGPGVFLRKALEDLRGLHLSGFGGRALARRRADLTDLVVISLFRDAENKALVGGSYRESGLAVVAVGGYGRRELCPHSDIDLMLLYRPEESGRIQELAENLFYPLWDSGLELGHGARTVEECLSVAAANLEFETSLLQARLLAGDYDLFGLLMRRLRAQILWDGGASLVQRLLAARNDRHRTYGDAGILLEPHVKEGRGGLRDVHEILWAAAALHNAGGLDGLAALGWLAPPQLHELERSFDSLLRARASLHYVADRRVDRLYFDYQIQVAESEAAFKNVSPETVIRRIFTSAQSLAILSEDCWEIVLREVGLDVRPTAAFRLPAEMPETAEGRYHMLTSILRMGYEGLPGLERLSHQGMLSAWLPGWEETRSLVQPDSYHTFTVDGHAFHCVSALVDLATNERPPDEVVSSLAAELSVSPRWERLLIACLLHDVGKGLGSGDHAEAGARLVARAVAELGLTGEAQDEIAFLVREHLLLVATATRRDLEDAALLERLRQRIGTRERLEMLYLLTVADSLASGQGAWTPWIAALVRELFLKLLSLFHGAPEAEPAVMNSDVGAAAAGEIVSFNLVIPGEVSDTDLILHVGRGQVAAVQELSVISPARHGLLASLTGVLAYHGINILSAQVQPEGEDLIARVFSVADYFGDKIPEDRWELVRRDIGRALEGRLALEYRLAEKAARYATSRNDRPQPNRVVVDNASSDVLTVIEVYTLDRIGLLHTITRALDDLLLEVRLAKVSTLKDRVVDVFYVVDAWGNKLTDAQHIREVELAILFSLERSG